MGAEKLLLFYGLRADVHPGETITIPIPCPECEEVLPVTVPRAGYQAWVEGRVKHVQDALPETDAGTREQLLTGICVPCFSKLFGPPRRRGE